MPELEINYLLFTVYCYCYDYDGKIDGLKWKLAESVR
jgi:hypothetical protein